MNNLYRELAPVTEAAWNEIETEATRTFKRHIAGRRVVDVSGPALTLPIFNAGKLSASLSVAEVTRDIQVATYEKTVQTAFREVADVLAERRTLSERMDAQKAEVDAYAASLRLSTERYRSGASSYLTVLDSQRSLYTAQKSLIALQLAEQSNRITLFKVLGGG